MQSVLKQSYLDTVLFGEKGLPNLYKTLSDLNSYSFTFFDYKLCGSLKFDVNLVSTTTESFNALLNLKGYTQAYLDNLLPNKKEELVNEQVRLITYAVYAYFYSVGLKPSEFSVMTNRLGASVEIEIKTFVNEKGYQWL